MAIYAARYLPLPIKNLIYRVRPLAQFIRKQLNQVVPDGLVEVTVAAGALIGCRLRLDMHAEKDYWLGTYEIGLQIAIGDWVKPGMVAYDIGANIGYVSLMLARAVGERGRVYAFEPLPKNLARLEEHMKINRVEERVTIVPKAVIDASKPVRFHYGLSHGTGKVDGSSGRELSANSENILVDGISLDDFVYEQSNPPPQVIKLDIEGGEVLALPGMRRLIHQARPLMLMELHNPQAIQIAWQILTSESYILCEMRRGYPVVRDVSSLGRKAYILGVPGDSTF